MKSERWVWLVAAVLAVGFWAWRTLAAPLPFYGFQSDPELHYFINSLLPANGLAIEHTDHPGTALQWTGAVMVSSGIIKCLDFRDHPVLFVPRQGVEKRQPQQSVAHAFRHGTLAGPSAEASSHFR